MVSSIVFQSLKKSIPQSPAQLAWARERFPALAPYPTSSAILDALAASSALSHEERDAILAVLLRQHAESVTPYWSTLLAVTFEPMLRRLARRVKSVDVDEAEQRALLAFLEIVAKLSTACPSQNIAGHFRVATESTLFRTLRKDHKGPPTVPLDDDAEWGALAIAEADRLDAERCVELMAKIVRAENDGEATLAMLLATTKGSGESLKAYVERVHADLSDDERSETYARMLETRRRVIPMVRAALRAEGRAA